MKAAQRVTFRKTINENEEMLKDQIDRKEDKDQQDNGNSRQKIEQSWSEDKLFRIRKQKQSLERDTIMLENRIKILRDLIKYILEWVW